LRIASDYRAAIEKRPADWMLHWKYGKLLTDGLKDYRLAVEEYETILELVPYHMAHVMLGTSLGYLGNYDKALEHFNKALKIQPTYAPAYYDMGLIYQKKKKMVKEAQSCYETALRLNPEHYPSYINLGALLADRGRAGEAVNLCRKGLEYFPDSADLHYNLGCFLSQNGQKDEAIKEFRQALKIDPNHNLAKQDLQKILKESK
jgi:tetratricopeptide (TPR) repeat protein